MLRQLTSITLLVSLIALASSGLLMIILGSFEFQLQMHPIHKVFGVIMCVAGGLHTYLNFKPIKAYLKEKKLLIAGVLLSIFMILLVVVGMNKPLDQDIIKSIEHSMSQLESNE